MLAQRLPAAACFARWAWALALCLGLLGHADGPGQLSRKVAEVETENEDARGNYVYRQTLIIEELDAKGLRTGGYREVREVIFSPEGRRTERLVGKPEETLKHLKLTPEDFQDVRDIQPLLLTRDRLFLYEVAAKGEETVDGIDCWVLRVRPRQLLSGMRLFEGLFWVDKSTYGIVRSEGQAVPQIRRIKEENLFPHFTTIRQKVDGKFWFPLKTYADDTLYFRTGPQRVRMTIRYSDYRRFRSETTITFPQQ